MMKTMAMANSRTPAVTDNPSIREIPSELLSLGPLFKATLSPGEGSSEAGREGGGTKSIAVQYKVRHLTTCCLH